MASLKGGINVGQKEMFYVVAGLAGLIVLGIVLNSRPTTVAALYDQKKVNIA